MPVLMPVGTQQRQPAEHLVLASGEPLEMGARLVPIPGLSQDLPVDHHLGVPGDHQRTLHGGRDCLGLSPRVEQHQLARIAVGLLLDHRRPHLEVEPEGREQRAALRRP